MSKRVLDLRVNQEWKETEIGRIPKEWQIVKFGELLRGKTFNGIYKPKQFHGFGIRIVNMGELFAYGKIGDQKMKLLALTERERENYLLYSGDLIFARRSLIASGAGKCSLIIDHSTPMTFESSIIKARPDTKKAIPAFLYYFFNSAYGRYVMGTILRQVAVSGITSKDLINLHLPVPTLPEQKAIAKILSSLDDKIDILHRQNKTLEEMADTLWRKMFIDEADKRWKIMKLDEICNLITDGKHGDCQNEDDSGYFFISAKDVIGGSISYDNARQITKADFEEIDRRTRLSAGDILITNSGTIGRMAIVRDTPKTRRTTFQKSVAILKPNLERVTSYFLYCLLRANNKIIIDLAGGTTQQNLLLGDLRKFEFTYPEFNLINQYDNIVSNWFNKMFANDFQIYLLTSLRDSLLPKLMSGEIRVKDMC